MERLDRVARLAEEDHRDPRIGASTDVLDDIGASVVVESGDLDGTEVVYLFVELEAASSQVIHCPGQYGEVGYGTAGAGRAIHHAAPPSQGTGCRP